MPYRTPDQPSTPKAYFCYGADIIFFDTLTNIRVDSRTYDDYAAYPVVVCCLVGGKEIEIDLWKGTSAFQAATEYATDLANQKQRWIEYLATLALLPVPRVWEAPLEDASGRPIP